MKFAYLVCFVALLQFQIYSCQDDANTGFDDVTDPPSTLNATTTMSSTQAESNGTSETESSTTDATDTTTDSEVPASFSYNTPGTDSTTDLTTEESTERSTTSKPSKGVMVYPTATLFTVLVPLCIRLAFLNLVGAV